MKNNPLLVRKAYTKISRNIPGLPGCGEKLTHTLLGGKLSDPAPIENSMEIPHSTRLELPYGPVISLLCIYPNERKICI